MTAVIKRVLSLMRFHMDPAYPESNPRLSRAEAKVVEIERKSEEARRVIVEVRRLNGFGRSRHR